MAFNANQNGSDMAIQHPASNTPHRRVLGDVSPNVKAASTTPAFLRKAPVGSPLKRSYTAAMEDGEGFMYLKKRKLTDDETLSQVDGASQSMSRDENGMPIVESTSFRPIFRPGSVKVVRHSYHASNGVANVINFQQPVPEIAEPSPTEPNTPTDEGDSTQDSSAERKSFSSLINYDPSSQPTSLPFSVVSNAELLKLRLRVAMYKVRTNQIDVPFTDLEVPQIPGSAKSFTAQAVEDAVAQLRREAQEVNARQPLAYPKLLPAPVLRPTAYSSRMIYDTNPPSSPPVSVSVSPEKLPELPGYVSTPQREMAHYGTPSVDRLRRPEQELTSSAVKGRVAEGLLGLRNAA